MNVEYPGYLYAAYKDVLAIEALSQNIDIHCEVIAFHAQQAAEKMIKNVFEANGVTPSKTHHLDDLLMEAINNKWLTATQEEIRCAIHLSHYAVAARYADTPDIGRGEALNAVLDCNKLSKLIENAGYPALAINTKATFLNPE